MKKTLAELKQGETGRITTMITDEIPLKLLEMGCLPGNEVKLLQVAPFSCPLYLNINDSHLAIRKDIAKQIEIELV